MNNCQNIKIYGLIFVLIAFCTSAAKAQCDLVLFKKAVQKARTLSDKGKYVEALDQLEAAKELCKDSVPETKKVRDEIIQAINKKNKDLEDKIKQLAIEQHKTEAAVDSARAAQKRAEKIARQSKSKELAAKALLEFSKETDYKSGLSKEEYKNETVALRLAYTALRIDTTKEAQDIFDKIIFRADNQFYIKNNENRTYNKDSSPFLTHSSDSTFIMDWDGKIHLSTPKGTIVRYNKDSSRFLIGSYNNTCITDWNGKIYGLLNGSTGEYNKEYFTLSIPSPIEHKIDSTYIIDWNGTVHFRTKGEIEHFNSDSSRFLTNLRDSLYIMDRNTEKYISIKGTLKSFNTDFSRFLVYDDSTYSIDWNGEKCNRFEGQVHFFNKDSSRYLTSFQGGLQLLGKYEKGLVLGKYEKGHEYYNVRVKGFNKDSSRFLTFDGYNIYLRDWNGLEYKYIYGEISGYNRDSSLILTYSNDSTFIIDWNGKEVSKFIGKISGFNRDSSLILACSNDSTYIIDWNAREIGKAIGSIQRFNQDTSRIFVEHQDTVCMMDWKGNKSNPLKGRIECYNQDSSRYLTKVQDTLFIMDGNWNVYGQLNSGWNIVFNKDSTLFGVSYRGVNYEDSTYFMDWNGKKLGRTKGYLKEFTHNYLLCWITDNDSTILTDFNGTRYYSFKGNLDDSSRFLNLPKNGKFYSSIKESWITLKAFNKDSSRFLIYYFDHDNHTLLTDWNDSIYINAIGSFQKFNKDSSRFLTYYNIIDWEGKVHGKIKGEFKCFNNDSSRFLLISRDSTLIEDWDGHIYLDIKGEFKLFNQDSSRLLVSSYSDSTFIIDWSGNKFGSIKGSFSGYNKKYSLFWTSDRDNTYIYDWDGELYSNFKGTISGFSNDSSFFWIYDYDSTRTRIYDWTVYNQNSQPYSIIKGEVKGDLETINPNLYGLCWTYDKEVTSFWNWNGKYLNRVLGKIKGFNKDFSRFLTYYDDSTYVKDIKTREIYGGAKGELYGFNKDSSRFLVYKYERLNSNTSILDWNGKIYSSTQGELEEFNKDSSRFLVYQNGEAHDSGISSILDWHGKTYFKMKGFIDKFNSDKSRFWIDGDYGSSVVDWDGKLYGSGHNAIYGFNNTKERFWTYHKDEYITRITDWEGKEHGSFEGRIVEHNKDSTLFLTSHNNTELGDWNGKKYGKLKGSYSGLNKDKSLFCLGRDGSTIFYNWKGQLACVYSGSVFAFKADNKHVIMRVPYYDGYKLETHRLYKNIHDFMKNEVAELTPEERVQYGVDDFVKE